ncbi:MAG: hypothetical protein LBI64_08100, partial [Coriobacteriales bacterium]|nr:hypothetical protein [Coriobacteriales bacterium]
MNEQMQYNEAASDVSALSSRRSPTNIGAVVEMFAHKHPGGAMSERYTTDSIIGVEEAQALLLSHVRLLNAEQVALTESYGRVLAQEVVSDIDISPFDNSAMDGFALRFEDLRFDRSATGDSATG